MPKRTALITGVTGQDGAYLAEFLLDKGYEVHGIKRRTSLFNTDRIDHLYQDPHETGRRFILHHGDLTDSSSLIRIIQQVRPDEIYNLAAQSHVAVSFEEPEYTANSDALGALRILEAIRILGLEKKTRFYQASTSELFGLVQETPQKETTPFYPRSPYACAKLYAYWITVNYREAYGMYACNGILFNHEIPDARRNLRHPQDHPRPGPHQAGAAGLPVPRQPGCQTRLGPRQGLRRDAVADAAAGPAGRFRHRHRRAVLGPRLCRCRRQGTGHGHPLGRPRCRRKGLLSPRPASGRGAGDEGGGEGRPSHRRRRSPLLPPHRGGDAAGRPQAKAKAKLGWTPKITFDELVAEMVREDLKAAERDELVKKHGYKTMDYHE